MEEKKEMQLDNVLSYEAGKADGIAEVLSFAEEWCEKNGQRSLKCDGGTYSWFSNSYDLRDALLQKFGGKG